MPRDTAAIHDLIRRYSFATVISSGTQGLVISHLPLLLDAMGGPQGKLIGHLARANSHSKLLADAPVTCIFHGPHGYLSPAWYVDQLSVPTWNYAVAHVQGQSRLIEDTAHIEEILAATVDKHEAAAGTGWRYDLPTEFRERLVKTIVGFEIEITSLEGKFKLSQNRKGADKSAALAGAAEHYATTNPDLVRMMREALCSD